MIVPDRALMCKGGTNQALSEEICWNLNPVTILGTPVIVLGMGRSGTSYLSSVLYSAGVELGADLIPGSEANPRGFFENAEVVQFHQSVLKRVRGNADWDDTAGDLLSDSDLTVEEHNRARRILEGMSRPGTWGWKDPRTVHFVRFWLKLLPNAKIIVPLRHPLEILYSYLKRIGDLDLLMDPERVLRAYSAYHNRIADIVDMKQQDALVLYAQCAFSLEPAALLETLRSFIGDGVQGDTLAPPAFARHEFSRFRLDGMTAPLFRACYPETATAFERLNTQAKYPFVPETADRRSRRLTVALQLVREQVGMDSLLPLLIDLARPEGSPSYVQLKASILKRYRERVCYIEQQIESLQNGIDHEARYNESLRIELDRQRRYAEELEQAKQFWIDQVEAHAEATRRQADYIREQAERLEELERAKQFWIDQVEAHAEATRRQADYIREQAERLRERAEIIEGLRQDHSTGIYVRVLRRLRRH